MTERAAVASRGQTPDADLDRVEASIRGWTTHITPLGPGTNRGAVFETVRPRMRLVRLVFDTPVALDVHAVGTHPSELLHIGLLSSGTLWEGRPVQPDVLMLKAGEIGSSFALPAGCELLVARLDRRRVDLLTIALRGPDGEPAGSGARLHGHEHAKLDELRAQLRFLLRGDPVDTDDVPAAVERAVYEGVAAMLASSPLPGDRPSEQRRRGLRRAVEYMRARAGEPISLFELCTAGECSERTLREAFRESFGLSPAAFLKRLRLEGLRRDLRDCAPHTATVAKLAARWGFWHMGHLGHDYRQLFGEPPSQTLARPRSLDYSRTPIASPTGRRPGSPSAVVVKGSGAA